MFLVENDPAFFDRADRQRARELFELVRREPGDILKAPQSSDGGCSNATHRANVADALVREQADSRDKYSFDGFSYPCNRCVPAITKPFGILSGAHRDHIYADIAVGENHALDDLSVESETALYFVSLFAFPDKLWANVRSMRCRSGARCPRGAAMPSEVLRELIL